MSVVARKLQIANAYFNPVNVTNKLQLYLTRNHFYSLNIAEYNNLLCNNKFSCFYLN